jgi:signal transduction histidine kinase
MASIKEAMSLEIDDGSDHFALMSQPVTCKADNATELERLRRELTQRQQAEESLRLYAERLRILREIDRGILAAQSLEEIALAALRHMRELVPCLRASIVLFDFESHSATVLAAHANGETRIGTGRRLSLDEFADVEALRQGRVYVVEDSFALAHPSSATQALQAEGLRSYIRVPLIALDELVGSLNVGANVPAAFVPEHLDIAREVADQLAVAIQDVQLFEQVRSGTERLQTLSRRLVEVQERERRSIARELHDEIGQSLTGLKLILDVSLRLSNEAVKSSLREAQTLVNDLMVRVREMSLDLRPAILDDLGLLPALLWHFERYTHQTRVSVTFKQTGLEGRRFPPEVETAAYRIVQEALTNVARHAGVSEVEVWLWANPKVIGIQVADEGRGFDTEAALSAGVSSGLAGMRDRAILLGGQLLVESRLRGGTRLTAEFPV